MIRHRPPLVALLLTCTWGLHAADIPDTCHLFTSFRGNGEDGLHLAWSADGLVWTALNGDRSFLKPQVGKERLMRDPCIAQGPDGVFHMVWTDSWHDRTIGYASSRDLLTWSEQKAVPVMEHEPTARNCWAPEIIWDAKRQRFLVFWSTTIPGRFPATEKVGDNNHRIYATTTRDFATWEPTRLFFEPGLNVIDATILPVDGRFHLFFKDEAKLPVAQKNLHLAVSDDVEGPFTIVPPPLNPPGSWVEGPTALRIAGSTIVYFDCYTKHRYGALRSRDGRSWEDVPQLTMPKGTRHGTALTVSGAVIRKILAGP